jgi:hypothetical protein
LLPAGAVAGWGLHPLESAALSRRTPKADIRQTCRERTPAPLPVIDVSVRYVSRQTAGNILAPDS